MEQSLSSRSIIFEFNKEMKWYSRSIIRIADKYKNIIGSGFLVYFQVNDSSDEGLYALCTAFHVLKTEDVENISEFLISFQGNIKLDTANLTKNFVKSVWSDPELDAIAIILNTYVAAHWMRLGASFLEISIPFVGMSIGIPQISFNSDFQIRGIKTGAIVRLKGTSILFHNCDTSPGSSGSPLINREGCVVGIHIGNGGRGIVNEKQAIILESFFISRISTQSESQLRLIQPPFTLINDESNNLQSYKNDKTMKIETGIHPINKTDE